MSTKEEIAAAEATALEAEKLTLELEKEDLKIQATVDTNTEVAQLKAEIEELKSKNTQSEKNNILTKLQSANIDTKGFEKYDNKQLEAVSEVFGNERGIAQLKAKEELKVVVKKPPKFDHATGGWLHYNSEKGKHE